MTDAEGEQLLRDNAELRAQVTKLVEQLAASNELIAKLNDRVGELLAVLRALHPGVADRSRSKGPIVRRPSGRRSREGLDEQDSC